MGLWPWSKKGNEEPDKPNVVIQNPFIAYVYRTSPKDCHGVKTIGKIGTYEHLSDLDELEEMVSPEWKGGTYRAKLHDDEDRRKYLGYHTWDVPGEPWLDGKPVQPAESKASSKDPVKQLQKQAEIAAAEKVLAQHQADLHQTRVKLGLEEDEDDDDDDDSSAEVELLRDEIEAMKAQRVEDERHRHDEDRERQWREEMKAMREKSDKRFEAMMVKMEEGKQGNDMQTMTQMVVNATQASAASTKEMMQQMIGILSTPSAASREAAEARQQLMTVINTQLEQLRSSGNNSIDNALGLFTKAIDMANQYAASGGSQENMWMMVLKEVSGGIKGAVEALTQAKQQPAPPQIQAPQADAGRITALAKQGAEQVIKQEAQRKLQTTDTAVDTTTAAANPVAAKEQTAPQAPQQKKEEKVGREEILATRRTAMINEFLEILAVEIKELTNDPVWPNFAYNNLPKDILDIMRSISDLNDISKLADVLRKDGDGKLVDETLVEIKKDPSAVKWLWQGIQEIQAADADIGDDAEADIDTTGE